MEIERPHCTTGLPAAECTEGDCQGYPSETWATLVANDFVNRFVADIPPEATSNASCEEALEQRTQPCRVRIDQPQPILIHVNLLHPDEDGDDAEACAEAWDDIDHLCLYSCQTEGEISTVSPLQGNCDIPGEEN